MLIVQHNIPQLVYHHSNLCSTISSPLPLIQLPHLLTYALTLLQDLVHTSLTANAQQQKMYYDKHTCVCSFSPGDLIWLSVPTCGKLQPKWQGKLKIIELKNPVNAKITD